MKVKRRSRMIYIRKRRTPDEVKKKVEEIKRTPDNGYDELELPENTKQLRNLFEQMPKDQIRSALSENKELALDYQNYLGVCYGGEKDGDNKSHVLCCDAERKDRKLTINPWNKRQMEAIGYYRSGEIFVRQDEGLDPELVEKMQKDIDNVLHLNGEKDSDGRIIRDTATQLIAGRRSICDSVHSQFERWDKKHQLTPEFLQDKILKLEKQLEENNIADEYIGVRLYLYKRKQKKLRKHFS